MLLAGDIGGTKTILAVYSADDGPRRPLIERRYASDGYASLAKVIHDFMATHDYPVTSASFGVAGPVVENRAEITNLPWVISADNVREVLQVERVHLQNDLQAIANAIPILEAADLYTLNRGEPVAQGAIAVLAPGTGLGEAYLTWDGQRYRAFASEGGHADFAPRNAVQLELLRYLFRRMDHVSYERICSGMGLPNIYAYLKDSGFGDEPSWLTEQLAAADDPTPVIVTAALHQDPPCELCKATLDIFVAVLAAEAGNLGLKVLATGGIYIGGGIPPRILTALQHQHFMENFLSKGRFTNLLLRMPVHVILNAKAPLIGAARYGLDELEQN